MKLNPMKLNPMKLNPVKLNPVQFNPMKLNPIQLNLTTSFMTRSSLRDSDMNTINLNQAKKCSRLSYALIDLFFLGSNQFVKKQVSKVSFLADDLLPISNQNSHTCDEDDSKVFFDNQELQLSVPETEREEEDHLPSLLRFFVLTVLEVQSPDPSVAGHPWCLQEELFWTSSGLCFACHAEGNPADSERLYSRSEPQFRCQFVSFPRHRDWRRLSLLYLSDGLQTSQYQRICKLEENSAALRFSKRCDHQLMYHILLFQNAQLPERPAAILEQPC